MRHDLLCHFLLYSLAVNYAVLIVWFLAFVFAGGSLRRLHGRWFHLADGTPSTRSTTAAWPSTRSGYCCSILRHCWPCT